MKRAAILFLLTLSTVLFSSCNTTQTDNDVLQNLESVVKQTTSETDDQFSYLSEIGEWYTPEIEYKYNPEGDNSEGIIELPQEHAYVVDDRIYIKTKRGIL